MSTPLRSLLGPKPAKCAPQPAENPAPLRLVLEPQSQGVELAIIARQTPCHRILVTVIEGVFTLYAPLCMAHGWVGYAEGCEHGAGAQICEGGLHQRIWASRAESLQRRGFVRVEGE